MRNAICSSSTTTESAKRSGIPSVGKSGKISRSCRGISSTTLFRLVLVDARDSISGETIVPKRSAPITLHHHAINREARLPQIGPLHSYLLTGFSSNLITVLNNSDIEKLYIQAMFYEKWIFLSADCKILLKNRVEPSVRSNLTRIRVIRVFWGV